MSGPEDVLASLDHAVAEGGIERFGVQGPVQVKLGEPVTSREPLDFPDQGRPDPFSRRLRNDIAGAKFGVFDDQRPHPDRFVIEFSDQPDLPGGVALDPMHVLFRRWRCPRVEDRLAVVPRSETVHGAVMDLEVSARFVVTKRSHDDGHRIFRMARLDVLFGSA